MDSYIIVSDYEDAEDGVLYWSNEDGWGHRSTATVFTDEQRNDGLSLPLEAAGWVKVDPFYAETQAGVQLSEQDEVLQ